MEMLGLTTFFAAGLGLGVVHAFDPDHLAAVGGLSVGDKKKKWHSALQWSFGHGGVLILIASAVTLLGLSIPAELSARAEGLVGIVLILIGLHAIWVCTSSQNINRRTENKGISLAPLVGMLHGTAGSAPLLALIPFSNLNEPAVGLVYVLLFCVGVSITMAGLGSAISLLSGRLQSLQKYWVTVIQFTLACFSLFFGLYLVSFL